MYVDECHNFLTLPHSFDDVLAEARGYHLSLILAHQHLGQLPTELRAAVSANARNKIYLSGQPRRRPPARTPHPARTVRLRPGPLHRVHRRRPARHRRHNTPAFTLLTRPAPPPIAGRADALRTAIAGRPRPAGRSRRGSPGGTQTGPSAAPSTAGIDRPIHSPIALSSDPPNRRIDAAHTPCEPIGRAGGHTGE